MGTMSYIVFFIINLLLNEPKSSPDEINLGDDRNKLMMFTDNNGHFLAIIKYCFVNSAPYECSRKPVYFYGKGKSFWNFYVPHAGGQYGEDHYPIFCNYSFVDPRYAFDKQPDLVYQDKKFKVVCGKRETIFEQLDEKKASEVLAEALFYRSPMAFKPYALLRDEYGNYFYVDRGRWEDNEREFRVFFGKRGNLQPLQLKNIVHDSKGDIFVTEDGELRLIVSTSQAPDCWWIEKNKRKLVYVPIEKNLLFIYNELGVYLGQRMGTPCDDL